MTINVIVNGAFGRMGQETVRALNEADDLCCVAECGRNDDVLRMASVHDAKVVVDFTTPEVVFENAQAYLHAGIHPVIGATGLSDAEIETLQAQAKTKGLGGVIAPNFSIAVVLMTQFAKMTAKYYPNAEIVEMHHENKLDAPSGTAIKTAKMIAAGRQERRVIDAAIEVKARGLNVEETQIHSVRLPGLIAHQEVMFGGPGELLTLRHDTMDRKAFMPGVLLACRRVIEMDELAYGLEACLT